MKNGIRRLLTLAVIPVATIMMVGVATPAFAQNPTHVCDNDPNPMLPKVFTRTESNPETGPIVIKRTDGMDCEIAAADIHAEDQIEIIVENGGKLMIPNALNIRSLNNNVTLISNGNDVTAPNSDIKSNRLIRIEAGTVDSSVNGSIDTKDIISNFENITAGEGDANILIRAQKDLSIGKVKTTGTLGLSSDRSGNVQIDANLHPSNNGNLIIGSPDGVEEVDIRSLNGGTDEQGNPSPFKIEIGVRITNGTDVSTGNITVTDPSVIKVKQSQSRSGRIEINANLGDLIFQSGGTLDTSSTNAKGGGNIYLFAEKIQFNGNVILNNEQESNAPNTARQIILAASTIDYKAGSKFEIKSDGDGISSSQPATVYFVPQGGMISESDDILLNLEWTLRFNGAFFFLDKPLHFDGGTAADLVVQADGDSVQIAVTGHPIIFDGKDVTFQTKGDHNKGKHEIVMGYFGPSTGVVGIDFGNTGTFELFVRGEGNNAAGGDIQVQTTDQVFIDAAKLNLKANGPANKSGDGGTIVFIAPKVSAGPDTKVKFLADASNSASGDAQLLRNNRKAIFFSAGSSTIPVGTQVKQYNFSANGGGSGGNAGAIEIIANGTVRMRDQDTVAIEAKAPGATGNGGDVKIDSTKTVFVQNENDLTNQAKLAIDVSGGTNTGQGGKIEITNAEHKVDDNPMAELSDVKQTINVNAVMNVDGGPNEQAGNFFGSIKLNGISCVQNKLQQTWPKTIWQCGAAANSAKILQGANHLPGGLKSLLGNTITPQNPDIQLYGMDSDADFKTFFDATKAPVQGANGLTNSLIRVTAVFEKVGPGQSPIETNNNSTTVIQAVTIHELGHQLDYIWGVPSGQSDFLQANTDDLNALNALSPATVWPSTIVSMYPGQNNEFILKNEINYGGSDQEPFAWHFQNELAFSTFVQTNTDVNGTLVPYIDNALQMLPDYRLKVQNLINNPPGAVN